MQVWSNPARQQLSEYDDHLGLPGNVLLIHDTVPSDVEDPCELTLLGHTSGVRCCCYSPGGDLVASTAEDASLRVWDSLGYITIVVEFSIPNINATWKHNDFKILFPVNKRCN